MRRITIDADQAGRATARDRAALGRRAEFDAGRAAARDALAQVGVADAHVGRTPRGVPVWPAGMTGSIAHSAGLAAAVVAPLTHASSIGVDFEPIGAVERELWDDLFGEAERLAWAGSDPALGATSTFCAKEAAFKALFPLHGVEIGFLDAAVEPSGPNHSFLVRVDPHVVACEPVPVRTALASGLVIAVAAVGAAVRADSALA